MHPNPSLIEAASGVKHCHCASVIQQARWLDLQGHVSSRSQPAWCAAQVAIVLFRTLVEFYDTPLGLSTLPLIVWRFATIGIGSILTGKHPFMDSLK